MLRCLAGTSAPERLRYGQRASGALLGDGRGRHLRSMADIVGPTARDARSIRTQLADMYPRLVHSEAAMVRRHDESTIHSISWSPPDSRAVRLTALPLTCAARARAPKPSGTPVADTRRERGA
jgi:hypothetical protein